MPKQKEWDYETFINTLTTECREGTITNIYCSSVLSNEGCTDGKQIGTTSAVLYQEDKETYHVERIFGETVTEQDIVLCSLHSGLDTLTSLLDVHRTHQNKPMNIALASEGALKKALNASPHTNQMESIKLIRRMNELIVKYPAINITLIWLPKKSHF